MTAKSLSKSWQEVPEALPGQGSYVYLVALDPSASPYKIDTKIRVRFFEDGEECIGKNFTMNLDKRSASSQDRKRVIDLFRRACNEKGQVLIHLDTYNAILAGVEPLPEHNRLQDVVKPSDDIIETIAPQARPEEPAVNVETQPAAPLDVNVVISRLLDRAEGDRATIIDLKAEISSLSARLGEAEAAKQQLVEENTKLATDLTQTRDDWELAKMEIEDLKLKLADVKPAPTPQLSSENAERFQSLFPEGVR